MTDRPSATSVRPVTADAGRSAGGTSVDTNAPTVRLPRIAPTPPTAPRHTRSPRPPGRGAAGARCVGAVPRAGTARRGVAGDGRGSARGEGHDRTGRDGGPTGSAATAAPPTVGSTSGVAAAPGVIAPPLRVAAPTSVPVAAARSAAPAPQRAVPPAPRVTTHPAPAPAAAPDLRPVADPAPSGPYYANCSAARAAGAAPLHTSDPGYRPALDRDHDGVACE